VCPWIVGGHEMMMFDDLEKMVLISGCEEDGRRWSLVN
jgi:hypothetical protein